MDHDIYMTYNSIFKEDIMRDKWRIWCWKHRSLLLQMPMIIWNILSYWDLFEKTWAISWASISFLFIGIFVEIMQ